MEQNVIEIRRRQVLHDEKWEKLLKRSWVFCHIPFLDFVLVAGSMATGNVNKDSDFDVIVAARQGRIFTARFFAVVSLGFLGWRRKKLSHKEAAADKICLNHFITQSSYRLRPPHNEYWKNLYLSLVPVFGPDEFFKNFWLANEDWLREIPLYRGDLRHLYKKSSFIKKGAEFILGGGIGNVLERILKNLQIKRIEKSLKNDPPGYKPRLIYGDEELEFHPDTKRIEEFIK
ncbi:MAG TPA: hypothetical protein VJB92_03610 [Candidatus Paceibacterota bacterium]